MHLGARTEVLLRVGKEVVRAAPHEVGAADFGVCNGKLGIATLGAGANKLVRCEERRGQFSRIVGDRCEDYGCMPGE